MIFISTITFFIFSSGLRRKRTIVLASISFLLVSGVLFFSSLTYTNLLHKGAKVDVLESRRDVWDATYLAALQGGWLGSGYGVTIGGAEFSLSGGLSLVNYGREKGNSQLAVIEETGVVGFIFYLLLLVIFFQQAFHCYAVSQGDKKVMMGLILGTMLGLTLQSIVEAWWGAPASPEAIYFWSLFGIVVGIMRTTKLATSFCTQAEAPAQVLQKLGNWE